MGATHKFWNTYLGPTSDLQLDVGAASFRYSRGYFLNLSAGGIDYTWPTSQTAGYVLTVNAGVLTWASPAPSFVSINKWSTDN